MNWFKPEEKILACCWFIFVVTKYDKTEIIEIYTLPADIVLTSSIKSLIIVTSHSQLIMIVNTYAVFKKKRIHLLLNLYNSKLSFGSPFLSWASFNANEISMGDQTFSPTNRTKDWRHISDDLETCISSIL